MGLGLSSAQILLELKYLGKFKNFTSVAEIGSQELHFKKKDLKTMYSQGGIDESLVDKHLNLDNWPNQPRESAKSLYKDLGFTEYTSIDLNKEHGSLAHDLNERLTDEKLFNKFDLVTDYGSCEHAFNIAECYRTMHNITKVNGLIIIVQAVYGGNGYFLFDRSFMEGISAANKYKILYSSYVVSTGTKTTSASEKQFHIPMSEDLIKSLTDLKSLSICMVLQKTQKDQFKIPYQGNYFSEKYNCYGFNRIYNKDDLSESFIPEYDIKNLSFKILIKEFFRRLKKKFIKSKV